MLRGRWLTGPIGTNSLLQIKNEMNHTALSEYQFPLPSSLNIKKQHLACSTRTLTSSKALRQYNNLLQSQSFKSYSESFNEIRGFQTANEEESSSVARCMEWVYRKIKNSHLETRAEALIDLIIPLASQATGGRQLLKNGNGFSSFHLLGKIFLSRSLAHDIRIDIDIFLNFMHEMGHQALMHLQLFDTVVVDTSKTMYSVIRATERPIMLSVHALVATAYMVEGLVHLKTTTDCKGDLVDSLLSYHLRCLRVGLVNLKSVELTSLGTELFEEFCDLYLRSVLCNRIKTSA